MSQFTDGNAEESSPTFPVSGSDENHAEIASDINWKLGRNVQGRACLFSPLPTESAIYTEDTTSLNSITNFFHDDPNVPYTRPPERTLEQSPCYPIIAVRGDTFIVDCILK